MVELLKQGQFMPMAVEEQVVSLWAGANGYLDDVPVAAVRKFEAEWLAFVKQQYPDVTHDIQTKQAIAEGVEKRLHEAVKAFKAQFKA